MQQEKEKKKSVLPKHGYISLEQWPHVNQGYGEAGNIVPWRQLPNLTCGEMSQV